jgi:hypothetical protein
MAFDEQRPVGRPPKFESPEQLKAACDEFIAGNSGKLTITGLAMWLGFCDRQSLYDYEKKPEFTCIIKEARLAVENDYELALRSASVTGAIFALKNMGWKDKTETAITDPDGNKLTLNILMPKTDAGS